MLISLMLLMLALPSSLSFAPATRALVSRENVRSKETSQLFAVDDSDNDSVSALASALTRLDQQWKLQQRGAATSRWTELFLENDDEQQGDGSVYLLEPPSKSVPSSLLVFVGGAGLGQYPHIAYNELLLRLSNRLNAAVLAVPYSQTNMDHFTLAKTMGELARRALIQCEETPQYAYPTTLPTYLLSHSLGGKLAAIYLAATGQEFEGIGFISFNNFAFSQTIGIVKEFAQQLSPAVGGNMGEAASRGTDSTRELFSQVFSIAETAVSALGFDFTPNPQDMKRIIELKYDEKQQSKTRLFTFADDPLQNTQEFCDSSPGSSWQPRVSLLPGTHLTPVYFRLGVEDLPEEVQMLSSRALGGLQTASFGNEEELKALVGEICNWILFDEEPSQRPEWQQEPAQLMASDDDTGSKENNICDGNCAYDV